MLDSQEDRMKFFQDSIKDLKVYHIDNRKIVNVLDIDIEDVSICRNGALGVHFYYKDDRMHYNPYFFYIDKIHHYTSESYCVGIFTSEEKALKTYSFARQERKLEEINELEKKIAKLKNELKNEL